ncbi:hypothetical protein EVAR_65379_1 [Eumeta japonica]|uniref:Uncharacterized protein n=1 Tax=Eumeta variegata TaxID=151549 RepID=A0A4C1ZVT3_EUMVA|nr:hypothetical protein EVAR_65379_1 [Eumeta japonica]
MMQSRSGIGIEPRTAPELPLKAGMRLGLTAWSFRIKDEGTHSCPLSRSFGFGGQLLSPSTYLLSLSPLYIPFREAVLVTPLGLRVSTGGDDYLLSGSSQARFPL